MVVEVLASLVMQTVAREHSGVIYAYQAEQLGAGNAASVGLQALDSILANGDAALLLGLAECERSRHGVELLASGQIELFGELMNISHNGDRVVT